MKRLLVCLTVLLIHTAAAAYAQQSPPPPPPPQGYPPAHCPSHRTTRVRVPLQLIVRRPATSRPGATARRLLLPRRITTRPRWRLRRPPPPAAPNARPTPAARTAACD